MFKKSPWPSLGPDFTWNNFRIYTKTKSAVNRLSVCCCLLQTVIDTACIVCGSVYVTVWCLSILSVPYWAIWPLHVVVVGLLLRALWAGNMDLQQQPPDRAPQQHGVQQHMQAVSCCQLTYKAEHRLVCVILGGYAFSQEEHGVVEQVGSHCSILILTLAVLSSCCSVYINAVVFRSLRHIMSDFYNIQMTLYINSLYICNCTHRFHFPSLVRVEN